MVIAPCLTCGRKAPWLRQTGGEILVALVKLCLELSARRHLRRKVSAALIQMRLDLGSLSLGLSERSLTQGQLCLELVPLRLKLCDVVPALVPFSLELIAFRLARLKIRLRRHESRLRLRAQEEVAQHVHRIGDVNRPVAVHVTVAARRACARIVLAVMAPYAAQAY